MRAMSAPAPPPASRAHYESVLRANLFAGQLHWAIDGGAPLHSPLFPSVDHDKSSPFNGFHRASTPAVLKDKEAR